MLEALEIMDRMRNSGCAPNQVKGARKILGGGNFIKIISGFNESRAKLSYQLKMHVRGVM